MTQIIGDAKHFKGVPLSGVIASGQVWEFDGSAFVPVLGPTAVGTLASGAFDVATAVSGDFSDFYYDEYPSFLADEFYPLSGQLDATSGVASYASGVVDDVSGQSGFVLASGAGLMVFHGAPASGKIPKLSGSNILTHLYWANDETSTVSGVISDIVGGRIDLVNATQIKWRFFQANQVRLWNPTLSQWEIVTCATEPVFPSSGTDLDGSGLAAGANYDVYAEYSGASGFDLVLKKWTNDTTRAVTPAQWQGVLCYNNTTDDGKKRRYIGVIRLFDNSGTPNFADNTMRRFILNYYNLRRAQISVWNNTAHDYDLNSWRPWNNDSSLTLMEWLSLQTLQIMADTVFRYDAGAAGERGEIRINVNGTFGAPLLAADAVSSNVYSMGIPFFMSQRFGYNAVYAEEYGYTNDLVYSLIGVNIEVWV